MLAGQLTGEIMPIQSVEPDGSVRQAAGEERTLLLVDDEESVLSALRRVLRRDGYRILTAASGEEALQILVGNAVDVIVSDQRMPGMAGVDLLRQVKRIHPETVRIVLSGYTELKSITDAINEGAIYKFMTKPWDDEQLRLTIREAFTHKELADENRRLNHALMEVNQELQMLLASEQQRLQQDETVLRIVQEILQAVPLPIVGMDEDGLIVSANTMADQLFGNGQGLIGSFANDALPPELIGKLGNQANDSRWDKDGVQWQASYRRLGPQQSAGCLLVLSRLDGDVPVANTTSP